MLCVPVGDTSRRSVLDKGGALTSCVSGAVDALRSDGTLAKLQQQWLAEAGNAPVLK
ncbi:hypothetical protein [Mycolicibacterium sarraceniae]|uniref:Amino acid ABC transporter substrate-binding protein n=1 Tax=Mycolicibacterium sarraceniae TaxID=1534348 RepID=A0A7I7SMN6_9MYCO|nr:hypothetical protein [Mycolicibacterium sarraceniae]BBY57820.1 hypothetical protein MSAR_09560 [Mycolicibacterium sarraceniae]